MTHGALESTGRRRRLALARPRLRRIGVYAGAKMERVSRKHQLGPGVERARRWDQAMPTYAQPVTAAAALLSLIWSSANGFSPDGELWLIFTPIAVGLIAWTILWAVGSLMVRGPGEPGWTLALQRALHSAGASAALLILILWLPAPLGSAGIALWLVVFFLGLGMLAAPLHRFVSGGTDRGDMAALAAYAAMLVMFWRLAHDGEITDIYPVGALRVVLVGLMLVVVASQLIDWPRLRRILQPAVALVAFIYLVLTLTTPLSGPAIDPEWPMSTMAVIVGAGLVAEVLVRLFSRPRAEVLSQRVDELSRSRRGVLEVQASELRRIERDLHDGAQVRLAALSIKLGRAEDRYRDDPETAALLREAREDATAAIRELRELARGIAPPILTNRGLEAAVQSIAQRSGTEVTVSVGLTDRPQPAVERAAYFVVAESLTNAAKHAPGARVEIAIDARSDHLLVEISDYGPGGADPSGGGLTGLRQRVEALDGTLVVTSTEGVGTQIKALLPCGS